MASPNSAVQSPDITPEELAGLTDFWDVYAPRFNEISRATRDALMRHPRFRHAVGPMTPETFEALLAALSGQLDRGVRRGDWAPYIESMRQQGLQYARSSVKLSDWLDVFQIMREFLAPALVEAYGGNAERLARAMRGWMRYREIQIAAVGAAYLDAQEDEIVRQQQSIEELSTPVLEFREGALLLPIIGVVDSRRALQLTEGLLNAIRACRARVAVLDVTGVPVVDSKVANHLLQTVEAARLMGARVFLTGLSPEIARALVAIGADLRGVQTLGDLRSGIEEAERHLGYRSIRRTTPDDAADDDRESW